MHIQVPLRVVHPFVVFGTPDDFSCLENGMSLADVAIRILNAFQKSVMSGMSLGINGLTLGSRILDSKSGNSSPKGIYYVMRDQSRR